MRGVPFCDLEGDVTTAIPTTTTAAVSVTPNTPPDTLSDVATATTPDYPVSVGGWIYNMIWIMFPRLVFIVCILKFNILCGVLSNNILH